MPEARPWAGILEVIVSEPVGVGRYELIVSPIVEGPRGRVTGGIGGAFDAIRVSGIDPALTRFALEQLSTPDGLVDMFVLQVVPEPGTGALLALGLLLLTRPRRSEERSRLRACTRWERSRLVPG